MRSPYAISAFATLLCLALPSPSTGDATRSSSAFQVVSPEEDPVIDTVGVDIVCPTEDVGERSAWSHAVLEVGLARLPGVIPTLCGRPPPPGLGDAMPPDRRLWVNLVIEAEDDALQANVTVCEEEGHCETFSAETDTKHPEDAIDKVLVELATHLGRTHQEGILDSPADEYTRRIASRATAISMGLKPASRFPGDKMRDPITRAGFLDPSLTVTQWAVARAGTASPERVLIFMRRGTFEHRSALTLAGEAWALEALEKPVLAANRWEKTVAEAPRDPRFLLPAARALIGEGRLETATRYLDRLPGQDHPDVVSLRVEVAQATGAADDAMLAWWQAADPTNPEPVRRRISYFLSQGDLASAQALTPALHARGEVDEALDLAIATAVNLGDLSLARTLAERSNRPIPNVEAPDLQSTDVQLDTVNSLLTDVEREGMRLANVQNQWVQQSYTKNTKSCSPAMTMLRKEARESGKRQRQLLIDAQSSTTLLQTLFASPTVFPLLDGARTSRAERLQQRLDDAHRGWRIAVEYQARYIEYRSRYCG